MQTTDRRTYLAKHDAAWAAVGAALLATGSPQVALGPMTTLVQADALATLAALPAAVLTAVVTDPPYGAKEFDDDQQAKLRAGKGGVWRIPPTLDGKQRQPLPRFTVQGPRERARLAAFFAEIAAELLRVLVPGGHVVIASNPLLATTTFAAFEAAGFENRGAVIRLVTTLRGGDRPKGAEAEFPDVSVMARAGWEPWGVFRKPCEGTVAANLRQWGAGGLRRLSTDEPFKDVIACAPARGAERRLAPHPSIKPQRFMRRVVRAVLPLDVGIVYDPFAGSGSTLAAAAALGQCAVGTERDPAYMALATAAFDGLVALPGN